MSFPRGNQPVDFDSWLEMKMKNEVWERDFLDWCSRTHHDPEDVGSAVQYEDYVRDMETPRYDAQTGLWS